MKIYTKQTIQRILLVSMLGLVLVACSDNDSQLNDDMPQMAPDVNFTALTNNNQLAFYNAQSLNSPTSTVTITGLQTGEMITSIDYRPATGQLYGLGSTGRLYFIHETSGIATALSNMPLNPQVSGANASIDFNPTVDRIRLVTESGQNLRLHPELGTVVATDGAINGGNMPRIGAVAYTNSMAGATSTQLFDIDFQENKLYIQSPPNDGGLELVGDLTVDFAGVGDFDINPDNSTALAVTFNENTSRLYTINLMTGKAIWVGTFGQPVVSLAFKTNPVAYATTADNKLVRFNPLNGASNQVDIAGMASGEIIVGLDFRPAKGMLYAITNQSRLLTINTSNGQTAQVGASLTPALSGVTFGFDFNPTVDRIRLVSNTGQNLRLHPDLGTVVATDGNLNPNSPSVTGAAYTNNVASATTTLLYVIDSATNMLYTQNPPNDGVLVPVGPLGINVEADNGFDIGGTSNMAFGLFTVNGSRRVYSINLTTGTATMVSSFPVEVTAMAVGLGF
jgi:WD40 repeat protein